MRSNSTTWPLALKMASRKRVAQTFSNSSTAADDIGSSPAASSRTSSSEISPCRSEMTASNAP